MRMLTEAMPPGVAVGDLGVKGAARRDVDDVGVAGADAARVVQEGAGLRSADAEVAAGRKAVFTGGCTTDGYHRRRGVAAAAVAGGQGIGRGGGRVYGLACAAERTQVSAVAAAQTEARRAAGNRPG